MSRIKKTLAYIILFAITLIILFPFFWTLYAASVTDDVFINSPIFQKGKYSLDNFLYILRRGEITTWFFNSLFVVTAITLANLLINTMAGYALARFEFKGKKAAFVYVTGIMMIPAQVLTIPIFLVVSKMNLLNTYAALILPFIFSPFGTFLMRQYFLGFPKEIEEAAKIDGMGEYATFFKLALPLSKNALMTQAIFIFLWNWNSFMLPSILVNRPEKFTLPLGIYQITNTQYTTSVTKSMAGATLSLIPTIVFYFIFQKKLINNEINSAVKG